MNAYRRVGIVIALALAIGVVLFARQYRSRSSPDVMPEREVTRPESVSPQPGTRVSVNTSAPAMEQRNLPRLVDLGAGKCIPCKMMAPILDELEKEYQGQIEVVFIDVWENRAAAQEYGIRAIPTQIFYDASGEERFRHQGFYSKKDILAKWRELGVDLEAK